MPASREPLLEASDRHTYYYRRSLRPSDYVMAAGVGLSVGLMAFYVAARLAQRTRLLPEDSVPVRRPPLRKQGVAG